jgi:hypothetical protein
MCGGTISMPFLVLTANRKMTLLLAKVEFRRSIPDQIGRVFLR